MYFRQRCTQQGCPRQSRKGQEVGKHVQKAREKLQFVAAELTDNAIRQYRAAGLNDAQISQLIEPYKNMFAQVEQEGSTSQSTNNTPTYVIDPKTGKLKLKK